ncbi:hypothetical protein EHQ61_07620 [Leptospira wolffii]|uniref:hypothetical protein n=1 Tax=Leptospira wolffii TaxID=409998 RepID=UPI001082599B|nr:hypothetical protein [Leptospira wolffii]TGL51821.1 hypothetical protein EHQ61_07620 [Leptospira wolffii]
MKIPYKKVIHYWNSKNVLLVSLIAIGLTAYVSFAIGDKPLVKHIEEVVIVWSAFLFLFLWYGLYHGYAWFQGSIKVEFKNFGSSDMPSGTPDIPDLDAGGEIGFAVTILAFLSWLLFAVILVAVLTYLIPFTWMAIVFVFSVLNWIFYHALRLVFIHSGRCHGNLPRSLWISSIYTLAYTLWLILLIYYYDFRHSGISQ